MFRTRVSNVLEIRRVHKFFHNLPVVVNERCLSLAGGGQVGVHGGVRVEVLSEAKKEATLRKRQRCLVAFTTLHCLVFHEPHAIAAARAVITPRRNFRRRKLLPNFSLLSATSA